jgi:hypothetical protein
LFWWALSREIGTAPSNASDLKTDSVTIEPPAYVSMADARAPRMKSMPSIAGAAAALVAFAALTALDASPAQAQNAEGPKRHHARSHRYIRLPPHHQPRRASAPDTAIEPTAKDRTIDRKISNICRGC